MELSSWLQVLMEDHFPSLAEQVGALREGDALREVLAESRQPLLQLLRIDTGGLVSLLGARLAFIGLAGRRRRGGRG